MLQRNREFLEGGGAVGLNTKFLKLVWWENSVVQLFYRRDRQRFFGEPGFGQFDRFLGGNRMNKLVDRCRFLVLPRRT